MKLNTENFSHTLLQNWRRCRYRFKLSYVDGVPRPPSIGQVKGYAGHAALADWMENHDAEQALFTADDAFREQMAKHGFEYDQSAQGAWEELTEALERYWVFSELNDNFSLVKAELEFGIGIGNQNLKGFIDAVVEDSHENVWLMEHKFLKRVSTKHLDLDPQVGIYMLAATLLGYKPTGVMYNIVRMGSGPTAQRDPVVRKLLYRNPEGLLHVAQEISLQIDDITQWLENGGQPVYRNATRDCSWDCSYFQVCLSIEDTGEAESVIQQMKKEIIQYGGNS